MLKILLIWLTFCNQEGGEAVKQTQIILKHQMASCVRRQSAVLCNSEQIHDSCSPIMAAENFTQSLIQIRDCYYLISSLNFKVYKEAESIRA